MRRPPVPCLALLCLSATLGAPTRAASAPRDWARSPVVPNRVPLVAQPPPLAAISLAPDSYLGRRVAINHRIGLLQTFDLDLYLGSYGRQPRWPTGEYLGKFMHGLSTMYLHTGDTAALDRLDRIVATWARVQAQDGWIGTAERFKSWDIWEHKYVLLGLLDYHALTADARALAAACRIGDLLLATIGPGLGDINQSGHWALGSASILEPMVCLYTYSGDARYLRFCDYIVESFEGPTGPKLITILTAGSQRVCDVQDTWATREAREVRFPNGTGQIRNRSKGYEMLSCLIGLVRMHQLLDRPTYLAAARNAWQDIAANRLYLAGSSGADECFKDDHCLPAEPGDGPAEACVTAHWMYLSRLLFELTGELRYADAIETSLFNHLLASQRPQDCHQSYNTSMNGRKVFARHDIHGTGGKPPCCLSSVMREIPRALGSLWTRFADQGLGVLIYHRGTLRDRVRTAAGDSVRIQADMATDYPAAGTVTLRLQPERAARFRLALRVPPWARHFAATVAGETHAGRPGTFLHLDREWARDETVNISFDLNERLVSGGASYPGHFAVMRGPQVLTLQTRPGAEAMLPATALRADRPLGLTPARAFLPAGWVGGGAYASATLGSSPDLALVPFADVGQPGASPQFLTWIPAVPDSADRPAGAPPALTAVALDGSRIALAWKASITGADGFRVERRRDDVGLWFHVKTTAPGMTACLDDAVNVVTPGKAYTYRVAAYGPGGLSAYSEPVAITTPGIAPPAVPTDLRLVSVTASTITLAWADRSDTEEGFRVERRIGPDPKWVQIAGRVPRDHPTFADYGLDPGQTYTYRVRSFNVAAESAWTPVLTIATRPALAQP